MWGMRWAVALVLATAATAPANLTLRSEQPLPITFNQGVARVSDGWILSGTNSPFPNTDVLVRTDEQLVPRITKTSAIPQAWRDKGYVHIGDIDVVGDVVYAPFEQPNYDLGHQATARYDAKTLAFIDAVELPQHENSFVAVDATTMTAWSQDHFDGDTLFRYDIKAGWKPLPPLQMSETLHHTQGAAVVPGGIWISTSDPANDIWFVDTTTGRVVRAGSHAHAGEGEGIDAARGTLDALENDASMATTWFEHFDLPKISVPAPAAGPAATAAGAASVKAGGRGSTAATGWYGGVAAGIALAALGLGYALLLRRRRSDRAAAEREQPVGR
ncbi:MAG: Glycerophosphoryl diester phosphodiesterase [Acidimicrobiales bacterium]|jgi:hypothetical protein|nr:Glycerophosphoryl diester phosphodiesterase [Acidimicrobiales bacterium]